MVRAPFTPATGGAYATSLKFATATDKQLALGPGVNPFSLFSVPGDDAFHNVAGNNVVQVAVGLAMQMVSAPVALVAMADLRVKQWTETSGGWLKKTVTQHVDGYTKPQWYIATPGALQPRGETFTMCAQNVSDPLTCPPEQVISSGVAWSQWSGGNHPAFEDQTSAYSHSESSLTLLAWVAIAFVVAFSAGAALAAAGVATTSLGPLSAIINAVGAAGGATGVGTAVTLGTVEAAAAVEAAFVGVVGVAQGASLTGAVNGPYLGADSGFGAPVAQTTEAGTSLMSGLHNNFDTPLIEQSGVRAVRQAAYGTDCATPGSTVASCGGNSGLVPRPDTGTQMNSVQFWQDNGKPLVTASPYLAQ